MAARAPASAVVPAPQCPAAFPDGRASRAECRTRPEPQPVRPQGEQAVPAATPPAAPAAVPGQPAERGPDKARGADKSPEQKKREEDERKQKRDDDEPRKRPGL